MTVCSEIARLAGCCLSCTYVRTAPPRPRAAPGSWGLLTQPSLPVTADPTGLGPCTGKGCWPSPSYRVLRHDGVLSIKLFQIISPFVADRYFFPAKILLSKIPFDSQMYLFTFCKPPNLGTSCCHCCQCRHRTTHFWLQWEQSEPAASVDF